MTDPSPTAEPGADTIGPADEGAELPLEERLGRLDRIVAELERGDLQLEAGLALFEEGVRHIRAAEALLARAELRVEELIGEAEELQVRPLERTREGEEA